MNKLALVAGATILLVVAVFVARRSGTAPVAPAPVPPVAPGGSAVVPSGAPVPRVDGQPPPAPPPIRDPRQAVVVAKEMVKAIAQQYAGKIDGRALKAYFDQVRRLGPAAIPAIAEMLQDADVFVKLAALNSLDVLRAASRDYAAMLRDGKSVAQIAQAKGVSPEIVQATLDAGSWDLSVSRGMAEAAWAALQGVPAELKQGAMHALTTFAAEVPEALPRILELARDASADRRLREESLMLTAERLAPSQAGVFAALSADPSLDDTVRLKAGMAWLKAAKDQGNPAERRQIEESALPMAEKMMRDTSLDAARRGAGIELAAHLQREKIHPELASMLASESDDAMRLAIIGPLAQTGGVETGRPVLERIAAEEKPSKSKAIAQQILKLHQKR